MKKVIYCNILNIRNPIMLPPFMYESTMFSKKKSRKNKFTQEICKPVQKIRQFKANLLDLNCKTVQMNDILLCDNEDELSIIDLENNIWYYFDNYQYKHYCCGK